MVRGLGGRSVGAPWKASSGVLGPRGPWALGSRERNPTVYSQVFRPGCKQDRGEKRHFLRKYEMRWRVNEVETQEGGSRWPRR